MEQEAPHTRHDIEDDIYDVFGAGESLELIVRPSCHQAAACEVSYLRGVLSFRCRECQELFLRIAVQETAAAISA
jgi:hypothetical protein